MTEPINFRTAKKRVKTARKEILAAENRVKFGQSKSEKRLKQALVDKDEKHIDGHKVDE